VSQAQGKGLELGLGSELVEGKGKAKGQDKSGNKGKC
jgi:hypothetical protein